MSNWYWKYISSMFETKKSTNSLIYSSLIFHIQNSNEYESFLPFNVNKLTIWEIKSLKSSKFSSFA